MPVYLIIEERDGDELRSYAKYDVTEPRGPVLIPISETTVLEVWWIEDLANHRRRSVMDAPFLEPVADVSVRKQ